MIKRTAILTTASPLAHGSERSRIKPYELPKGVENNYTPLRRLPVLLKFADTQIKVK